MEFDSIPQKSPELLLQPVGDGYAYAVNCSYPNSFRLLNQKQYEILLAVNGRDDLQVLAERFEMPFETLESFMALLSQTEIVSFGGNFTLPQKPAAPKSLNFWIHTTCFTSYWKR